MWIPHDLSDAPDDGTSMPIHKTIMFQPAAKAGFGAALGLQPPQLMQFRRGQGFGQFAPAGVVVVASTIKTAAGAVVVTATAALRAGMLFCVSSLAPAGVSVKCYLFHSVSSVQ